MLHGITHPSSTSFMQKLQSAQAAGTGQDPAAASGPANDAFAALLMQVMNGHDSATSADTGSAASGLELLFGATNANTAALQQALTGDSGLASLLADDDATSSIQASGHRHAAAPPALPPEAASLAATQTATARSAGPAATPAAAAVAAPAAI